MHAVLITCDVTAETEALADSHTVHARAIAAVPGLVAKTWLRDGAMLGGFYLFADRAAADAYLDGPWPRTPPSRSFASGTMARRRSRAGAPGARSPARARGSSPTGDATNLATAEGQGHHGTGYPPSLERLVATAARYGCEITVPPPAASDAPGDDAGEAARNPAEQRHEPGRPPR